MDGWTEGALAMDVVQKLFDSWDEGEEENYPASGRVPASEAEISTFEARHDTVLPELAKQFYRRVNGMTRAEFERDTNHFLVKFFSLQEVFPVDGPPHDPAAGSPQSRFFAIATVGHHDPGPNGYDLVYGLELPQDRSASHRVIGIYRHRQTWFEVAGSFEEFLAVAATRNTSDAILDPDYAGAMEALRTTTVLSPMQLRRKRRWWPWKT